MRTLFLPHTQIDIGIVFVFFVNMITPVSSGEIAAVVKASVLDFNRLVYDVFASAACKFLKNMNPDFQN